jgi:hypothetical protein
MEDEVLYILYSVAKIFATPPHQDLAVTFEKVMLCRYMFGR